VPQSEWPPELSETTEQGVAGEYLRLDPDGLVFSEPALLSRRVDEVAEITDGAATLNASLALSRSDGVWETLPQTVTVDDDGAVIETPIGHFSNHVIVFRKAQALVKASLNPANVQRQVGHHFLADLSVDPQLGSITENSWRTFFTVDSGPLVLGIPSDYRVNITKDESSASESVNELVAPFSTPMPLKFPAAYNCTSIGKASFGATFQMVVKPVETIMHALLDPFDDDEGPIPLPTIHPVFSGSIKGTAECVENTTDLTPGLIDVESSVASDPANHSCCVSPPPRKARMTLGSLWFTDAKLGSSVDWQGLFFDQQAGSSDDVMSGLNRPESNPPSTVEIHLADDFDESGRFSVDAVGVVGGFSDIRVTLEAVATDRGTWRGTLTKGADGGLPTGQPIVYDINGTLIAPQPIEFVEILATAFREGNSQFLLEHLHPEVLKVYAGECVEFTDAISSPDLDISVHSISEVATWVVTLDGAEVAIPNALSLDVTRTENGQAERTTMHVAPRPGDGPPTEMAWFADCGDPFSSS